MTYKRLFLQFREVPCPYGDIVNSDIRLLTPQAVANFLFNSDYPLEPEEVCLLITLNAKSAPISLIPLSHGNKTETIVDPADIFKRALLDNATSIIIIHNHPSGDVTPSPQDIAIAGRVRKGGDVLNIKVLDFIIIAGAAGGWGRDGGSSGRYYSMQESGDYV